MVVGPREPADPDRTDAHAVLEPRDAAHEEREEGVEARPLGGIGARLLRELGRGRRVAPRSGVRLSVRVEARVRSRTVHRRCRDDLAMSVRHVDGDRRGSVLHDETHGRKSLVELHAPHLASGRLTRPVRAIVVEKPNVVRLREVDTAAPGPGEARVRSILAGVCRTDLDIVTGVLDPRWVRFPVVPGHEWSGVVDAVGADVTTVEPGDRVVCEGNIGCMSCARCRAGDTHLCERYDAVGFTRSGGWGELVVVPARILHTLPDHVSFEAASLVEPGSCVVKALDRARIEPAETVGVVGVGAMGALAIRIARLRSPATIVAYGVRDEELELALRVGADEVVNVDEQDAESETRRLVGGGLDVAVETAGAVPAVELATRLAREGGRVVVLGIAGSGQDLVLPADRIPLRDLTVLGSVGYTTAAWAHMVGLLRERLVDLEPIVTHRFPLDRYDEAFALMDERRGVVGRVVLEHASR